MVTRSYGKVSPFYSLHSPESGGSDPHPGFLVKVRSKHEVKENFKRKMENHLYNTKGVWVKVFNYEVLLRFTNLTSKDRGDCKVKPFESGYITLHLRYRVLREGG